MPDLGTEVIEVNTPIPFVESWLEDIHVNHYQLERTVRAILFPFIVTGRNEVIWALKALSLTDLTTLSGDDTKSNVTRLCEKAAYPFPLHILNYFEDSLHNQIHTAAVCVYPARVADAYEALKNLQKHEIIAIASVATGFPSGQYPLETRLSEIKFAIANGATEIDIVIDRALALTGKWQQLYDEIVEMRKACGTKVHMKTILGVGELGTIENVYKCSLVAMMAGTDFIKTSTGKEAVNATLPIGLCMINAIREFNRRTHRVIGLKPAGGVRTVRDAINWMILVKETLGMKWLKPELFRFGASGLLEDINKVVLAGYNAKK